MPKFTVLLQQFVEEIAEMEVEAEDENQARSIALDNVDDADWTDGSDSYSPEVYGVKDGDGKMIWER